MKKLLVSVSIVVVTLLVGCGWWNSGGSQTAAQQAAQEIACGLAQVESGNVDPVAIAVACTGGLLASFVKDIESIIAYYTTPAPTPAVIGDAGLPTAMVCGAAGATPPYPGAPTCVTAASLASMKMMHEQAKSAIAAGAK